MKRALIAAGVVVLLSAPAAGGRAPGVVADLERAPEGCEAVNPVAPTCTFTVTEDMEGPVAGAAGWGDWVVKVKRGKKVVATINGGGSYGEPHAEEFLFKKGDKVSVAALSPGSGVIAGGD